MPPRSSAAVRTASMWPASSGPGSITVTGSRPIRYVLVPSSVIGPGFGATIVSTSGPAIRAR